MKKIQYITTMGLFFALALVLSALEGLLPPMPFLPPGKNKIVFKKNLFFSLFISLQILLYFHLSYHKK